ncbi:MAG: hypothetical protein GC185_10160 [Alphaproteobacteria bacterium]|nr:hypothetical protein [Alphaproteobacteria bacterium]
MPHRRYPTFISVLVFTVLLALPARASFAAEAQKPVVAQAAAPARAALVGYWESYMRKDPHVSRFKETGTAGVYDFKTDFFPYDGRLKLLNAVVTKAEDSYYPGLYSGIVEVELMDAKPDFFKKYAASYGAWTRQNYFYFDAKKNVWFPSTEWSTYTMDLKGGGTIYKAAPWQRLAASWGPWVFYCVLILGLLVFARRANKRVWSHNTRALEEQQRGLAMVEESQRIQKEQTELLKEILATLKKK